MIEINRPDDGLENAREADERRAKIELARQRLESGYYLTDRVLEETAEAMLNDNELMLFSL